MNNNKYTVKNRNKNYKIIIKLSKLGNKNKRVQMLKQINLAYNLKIDICMHCDCLSLLLYFLLLVFD